MNVKYFTLKLVLLLFLNLSFSQSTYDIILAGNDKEQQCQSCYKAFNRKPEDVTFLIKRDGRNLFFEINDKWWFDSLFQNSGDGIAIDIVLKDRYNCGIPNIPDDQIRGFLTKPIYADALKRGLRIKDNNKYQVHIGKIPDKLINYDFECNILFLGNKNLCRYYVIYDLETYEWDLLNMGMFMDGLTFNAKQIQSADEESYIVKYKKLKFTITFEKNKSNYTQADIRPIYNTLRLTDFNVKDIDIKAYSSIEGESDRNIDLQDLRAKSIIAALQAFQKPTIKTIVSTSENWVELFNDIRGTQYSYLLPLTKSEIKEKIAGKISRDMEPIFKNHRKAVIELELEKKDRYRGESIETLLNKFDEAVINKNIEEVNEVQNSIFEKIYRNESPMNIVPNMSIPYEPQYAKILIKNAAFKYMFDAKYTLVAYNELLELDKLFPGNGELKYNILALKIKLWQFKAIDIDESRLKRDINNLKDYGIESALITRMLVNFNINRATDLLERGDFDGKDESIAYINNNYKKFSLSNYDYLSLAQFFIYYNQDNNMAVTLLEDRLKNIDVDEDLIFYYLNLTLIDKGLVKDSSYRTIMLNAININRERFCELFRSHENGGVTFQLLENEFLRDTYCENCANPY